MIEGSKSSVWVREVGGGVRRGGVQVGGKGFDGGRESVALDILRQAWKNGRMEGSGHASSPESVWPARTRLASGPRTLALSQQID